MDFVPHKCRYSVEWPELEVLNQLCTFHTQKCAPEAFNNITCTFQLLQIAAAGFPR
jgi:hypothetical protein